QIAGRDRAFPLRMAGRWKIAAGRLHSAASAWTLPKNYDLISPVRESKQMQCAERVSEGPLQVSLPGFLEARLSGYSASKCMSCSKKWLIHSASIACLPQCE